MLRALNQDKIFCRLIMSGEKTTKFLLKYRLVIAKHDVKNNNEMANIDIHCNKSLPLT